MNEGIKIKPDGFGGNALFANRRFSRGDIVLQERAFLVFDPSSQRARHWMAQAARSPSARPEACPDRRAILCHSMAFQALYAKATPEVQAKVQSLYCHPLCSPAAPGDHALYAGQALAAARAVRCPSSGAAFQACRGHTEAALARVPMLFNTNSFGVGPGNHSFGLLYLAARFNHACGHTCLARLKQGATIKFVAVREISEGELLTHDYHDGHTVAPTPLRRLQLLDEKFFHCACHLCTAEVDRFRALPCPRCSGAARAADGTLGEADACWGTAGGAGSGPAAVVLCDMALATAGAPRPWTCQGCNATFSDSIPKLLASVWGALGSLATDPAGPEVALERHLTAVQEAVVAVEAAGKQLDPDASLFFTVADLHATACMCLGPAHWCSWRAKQVLLECRRLQLQGFLAAVAPRAAHADDAVEAAGWLSQLALLADAVFAWVWARSPAQAFHLAAPPVLKAAECLLDAARAPALGLKCRAEAAVAARSIIAAVGQARAAHAYIPVAEETLEALLRAVARAPAASLQLPPAPQLACLAPGSPTAAALAAQIKAVDVDA